MKRITGQTKALLLAGLVVLFWSTVATAFKIALEEMHFTMLLLISSVTALLVSFADLLIRGKVNSITAIFSEPKALGKSAFMGLLNPFLYYMVLFKAYSLLPAQIAQPLNYSWQVVLIIMISIFLKQKMKWYQVLGIIISFAGILMLSGNNSASADGKLSLTGIILALGSAFIWATYWLSKIDTKYDASAGLFANFLFGSIYLIVILMFMQPELPSFKGLFAGIYVGVFEMGLTFILWGKALNLATNRVTVTQLTYLSPVLSLFLIHFVLGESIGIATVVGLFLIIGGILFSSIKFSKQK
ncbi:MAG: DMT family transporter [Bacteroidales bacterium]|nr:DMT family transporter [Bacteroidales bacterium]